MLSSHSSEIKLLVAIGGIYTCFITFAINTEGLYSYVSPAEDGGGTGGGIKFTATLFFLLVQCLTNTTVAGAALLLLPSSPPPATSTSIAATAVKTDPLAAAAPSPAPSPPVLDYITAGASYISAMLCSTEALKYVSLPMQALGKSCKMVPVMLFGFLIRGKRYSFRETLAVLLITAGISVFQQKQAKHPAVEEDSHANTYGLVLLFLSLVLDGVTGACQDRMRERYRPSTHQMMFHMNLWASVLLTVLVATTGQLSEGLSFCHDHPSVVYFIGLAALSMAAGQNFIFFTLAHFDALTLATITTTRKFFTIIVSTIYYQHHFKTRQQVGVGLVFLGLLLELINKYWAKQEIMQLKQKKEGGEVGTESDKKRD